MLWQRRELCLEDAREGERETTKPTPTHPPTHPPHPPPTHHPPTHPLTIRGLRSVYPPTHFFKNGGAEAYGLRKNATQRGNMYSLLYFEDG